MQRMNIADHDYIYVSSHALKVLKAIRTRENRYEIEKVNARDICEKTVGKGTSVNDKKYMV